MSNTVSLVITALINCVTSFLQTDIAQVFVSVIIIAVVIRMLIKIFHIRGYN